MTQSQEKLEKVKSGNKLPKIPFNDSTKLNLNSPEKNKTIESPKDNDKSITKTMSQL